MSKREVVVITGASGGVGRATVREFAKRQARIGLIARNVMALEAAKREVEGAGGEAIVAPADVASAREVEAAAARIEEEFGPPDVWINNAMVSLYGPFTSITPEEYQHITDVTYHGQVWGTMAALKRMLPRNKGTIVQVGSALAFRSIPLQSAYCGAKHAVAGFTESVRTELIHMKSNVHVTLVDLPGMNTTQFSWTLNKMPQMSRPCGPIYQPEIAADAIYFAAHAKRKSMSVGLPTVESVQGEKVIAGMLDHYLAKAAWDGSQLPDEPTQVDAPNNFWQPVAGDWGSHGPFDNQAKRRSVQVWANKNRGAIALAGLGVAAAAGVVLARRMMKDKRIEK